MIASKYELKFGAHAIDLDTVAVQKDRNVETGTTAWIFKDGSALTLNNNIVGIVKHYGLHCDHEQLR
jgi:hypothetical protein